MRRCVTAEFVLVWHDFGKMAQPLQILDHKLADQATARYFEVVHQPLSPSELREEPGARSGVLLRVTVKPGLPEKAFQQTILIRTNLESNPAFALPISGAVGGDISVAGPGWDALKGELTFEATGAQQGAQRRLTLSVRGPHR